MMRGFLGGALSGGVLGLGVAVVASIIAPTPQPPEVSDAAPGVATQPLAQGGSETDGSVIDATPQGGQVVVQAPAPDPDTLSAVDAAAEETAQVPQTGAASGLAQPADVSQEGSVAPEAEEPVFPNPQALAPMVPQEADDLSISTEPAQPPQPEAGPQTSALDEAAEVPGQAEAVEAPLSPLSDAPLSDAPVQAEDQAPVAPLAPVVEDDTAQSPAQDQGPVVVSETPAAPQADETPERAAEADLVPVAPPAGAIPAPQDSPLTEENKTAQAEAETAEAAPQEGATEEEGPQVAMIAPNVRPQIGTPAITLTDRNTGVTVNRLSPGTQTDTADQTVTVITEEGAARPGQDTRPIARHGQPFANPENKPLMSIVLIDNGSSPTAGAAGIAALRSFPYTLSFAVDSSLPDAAERVALYREAGFEVLAMIDLPPAAQATDAETTLGVTLSQMRDVVGVLEGPAAGLQGSRAVSDQVTAILQQSGHGLVTQAKGLNTMPKLAVKAGVPAAPIFRDFDSKDQSATVIRRFLDQAAFKAGQEGAVIMLGRLRPDTISALLLWGLQDRAGQVALAPISAVLLNAGEAG